MNGHGGMEKETQHLQFGEMIYIVNRKMDLVLNETENKYMVVGRNWRSIFIQIVQYKFENIQDFVCLGTYIGPDNEFTKEEGKIIFADNRS